MTKLKKIVAFLLVCALLASACGCTALTSLFSYPNTNNIANPDTYKHEFENNVLYNQLNDSMQRCYGSMYTALTEGFDSDNTVNLSDSGDHIGIAIQLPDTLSDNEEANQLYTAFFNDNPQFFYVNNTYAVEGYQKNEKSYYNKLILTYSMQAQTRKTAHSALDAAVDAILRDTPDTSDEYILEKYLHDKLINTCIYDDESASQGYDNNPNAYTVYGALVEGKAVCEGYSRAMQLLLSKVNIENTLVTGFSLDSNEGHMWNQVRINGDYYHLDATWNDSDNFTRHNYFNITTNQLLLSHRIDDNQPHVKNCTAMKDNYYYRNGLFVDTYSRQTIAQKFAETIKSGEKQLEMMFAADKFDSARLFLKNWAAVKEQVSPFLAESGEALWQYSLYAEEKEHILLIRKK